MHLILLIAIGLLCRTGYCSSAFRFGAVLSTEGRTRAISDARNGYDLYFESVNALNDGRGFYVSGRPNTTGFYFTYEFLWREDFSSRYAHKRELKQLLKEERIHFLGGSHLRYAKYDMRLANKTNVLCYHCCVPPDTIYEPDYRTSFGIPASSSDVTRTLVRRLAFENVKSLGIIYEGNDEFTRTTCLAAETFIDQLGIAIAASDKYVVSFNSSSTHPRQITKFARESKNRGVEAVIACVDPDKGKALVHAFDEAEYSLKALFLTVGPTKQWWVDSFDNGELVRDVLSATQWHHRMKYTDDFFGSTKNYVKQYREKFWGRTPDQDAAGASAVGLTLTLAIQNAFAPCDITKTGGDVDALLHDVQCIECADDLGLSGYDRVLHALSALDVETFYGKVQFNHLRRNTALTPVTTQVFQRTTNGEHAREIEPVLPFGYATELLRFPAENRFRASCLAGSRSGEDPFSPCQPCEAGTASHKTNAKHCDSCPVGYWTNRTGQSSCEPCPLGTSTSITGAKKITDCVCKPGFFNFAQAMGVECEPCPKGATCGGGTSGVISDAGYWHDASSNGEVYKCERATSCLGGINAACREGYAGRLCAGCADGYFGVIQTCHKCSSKAAIVFLFALLLVGWYVINVIVSESVASLEMMLSWAQLANIIGDVDLNWTSMLTTMFGIANILDFDVDILEPSCLMQWSFRDSLVVQLCLPFVMTLMAACGWLCSAIVFIALERRWITLEEGSRKVFSFFVKITEDREELSKKRDATVATFLASVDTTYVTIAKYCFDCFKCERIAGVSVLGVAPEIMCGTQEHTQLIVLSSLGIVFYVIGFLVCVSWKLYDLHDRRTFADETNILRFGFVYQKYELDYYYTPAIALVRKLMFVFVLVYINNPAFQVGTLAIVITASLVVHTYTAPYIETYLDILFNFLLLALMFEAFGGLMFYSENLPSENRFILEWIVMSTLFLLILVFAVIFCMEMLTKFHIHEMKKRHREFARREYGYTSTGCFGSLWELGRKRVALALKRTTTIDSRASSSKDVSEINYELLHTFSPGFVYEVLKKRPDFIQDWDKLTIMLKDYMSDQAETSYLSMEPSAKFWRKLVDRFPELIDFLAVSSKETRYHFNEFATQLYSNFYLSKKVTPLPLMQILNWRDHAPMAQWLAIAPEKDRTFFNEFVSEMFRTVGNEEAAWMLQSRVDNKGQDTGLMNRCAKRKVSKKQQLILDSISSGSNPFQHSAAKAKMMTATQSIIGAMKMSKVHTLRSLDSAEESSLPELPGRQGRLPVVRSKPSTSDLSSSSSKEKIMNNQTIFGNEEMSDRSKLVPFSVCVGEMDDSA